MTLGPITAALGFILMLWISPNHTNYLLYLLPGVLVFSLGLVLTVAPLTATVMSSVQTPHSGIASATNNAVARLAGLLIVAFLGIIVAKETTISVSSTQLSAQSQAVIKQAIAGGLKPADLAALPADETTQVRAATAHAQRAVYTDAVIINALLALSAGIISFIFIKPPRGKHRSA
jgi:hypothetical protein